MMHKFLMMDTFDFRLILNTPYFLQISANTYLRNKVKNYVSTCSLANGLWERLFNFFFWTTTDDYNFFINLENNYFFYIFIFLVLL